MDNSITATELAAMLTTTAPVTVLLFLPGKVACFGCKIVLNGN